MQRGYLTIVKMLLERGADPEAVDCDGRAAVHLAAANDHCEVRPDNCDVQLFTTW